MGNRLIASEDNLIPKATFWPVLIGTMCVITILGFRGRADVFARCTFVKTWGQLVDIEEWPGDTRLLTGRKAAWPWHEHKDMRCGRVRPASAAQDPLIESHTASSPHFPPTTLE